MENNQQNWTEVISSETSLLRLNFKEVWRYKDLLLMFVKRDFVTFYKQTVLGPLWFVIQPLLTTFMYVIIFGNLANLSTDKSPKVVFYLAGVAIWSYFSETLTKTASVFTTNANIFGKVYFPRLIMPLSLVVSGLIKFAVQFLIFIAVLLYYYFVGGKVHPNGYILLTPILLFLMAILALGLGMIISSMTTKYKDLTFLISFGIQLFMYATPVVYPLSSVPEKYKFIMLLNPLTSIFECFRYAFLGSGSFNISILGFGALVSIIILFIGILIFNKVEKNFIDTV